MLFLRFNKVSDRKMMENDATYQVLLIIPYGFQLCCLLVFSFSFHILDFIHFRDGPQASQASQPASMASWPAGQLHMHIQIHTYTHTINIHIHILLIYIHRHMYIYIYYTYTDTYTINIHIHILLIYIYIYHLN